MFRKVILLFSFFVVGSAAHAQSFEDFLPEVLDMEEFDGTAVEETYDYLHELEHQHLNINTATYEEMCRIPGMTIDVISDIMYYRDTFGAMRTMDELVLIPSVSRTMRQYLRCFFVAEVPPAGVWYKRPQLDSLLHRAHGTLLATTSIPLYDRMGDLGKYKGDKFKYSLKLKGSLTDNLRYGVIGAKDAGEPFFSNGNSTGFDHYSAYVTVKNLGFVKAMTLGHYKVRFGQGLILNSELSLGKQFSLSSGGNAEAAFSGSLPRNDGHYLQGGALTAQFAKRLSASAFYSYRKLDATLNKDGTVSTILTTGYHRTDNDMAKRNNTSEVMAGAHLAYKYNRWRVGMSGVYTWYDRPLAPNAKQLFRQFYPRGNEFWNASIDYAYLSRRLNVTGETATGDCGAVATVNTITALLPHSITLTSVLRHYPQNYHALLANAFNDGGYTQNETGAYLGIQMPLFRRLHLNVYTDYAHFPWAKSNASAPSNSWDNSLSLTLERRRWDLLGRYRFRLRQRNNSEKTALLPRYEHTARLSTTWNLGSALRDGGCPYVVRLQADGRMCSLDAEQSRGVMFSTMFVAKPFYASRREWQRNLSASVSGGYFNTTDYDSRIYLYERGTLESFSFGSYSGRGMRASGVLRSDLSSQWMIMAKFGFTCYFDRQTISSADREIPQNYQTDIDLQLRMKF